MVWLVKFLLFFGFWFWLEVICVSFDFILFVGVCVEVRKKYFFLGGKNLNWKFVLKFCSGLNVGFVVLVVYVRYIVCWESVGCG